MIELMNNYSVKKFIAILVTLTFCYLAIKGDVETQTVKDIVLMVFTFYFSNSYTLKAINQTKNMIEK